MSSRKNKIFKMYFKQKMKPKEIADKLKISQSAVSQVLFKHRRYKKEKQDRIKINEKKHVEYTKSYIKEKRKAIQHQKSVDDLVLRKMHDQASIELSGPRKLSNMAYRNWNKSAYTYNESKSRFEIKKELESKRSSDVPKYIKVEVR